ncbi:hypothetical protein DPX16_12360 [Anabarilius grahami]|uniref:Uncharacterized protein n=1 Tax=Anabarilius grahami TaxID=495550 RepID=A0A3N0XFS5_ANAGA|nr:hypothetical protein DPX16_12360 [Anabarilius grahami]
MLARGRPVSWARLSQPFLKQSEGFGLDAESPRDALWHFPHAEDNRAEGNASQERQGLFKAFHHRPFSSQLEEEAVRLEVRSLGGN